MNKITGRVPHAAVAITDQLEEHAILHQADSRRGIHTRTTLDARHTTDPKRLLDYVSRMFLAAGEGNLVVDRVPVRVWDDGDDAAQLREFAELARLAGWEPGAGVELGKGWVTWMRDGSPKVHMAVRRMLDEDTMIPPESPTDRVLERLCRYAQMTYAAYIATPGVSGLAAIRNLYDRPKLLKAEGVTRWGRRPQPKWVWNPPMDITAWGCGDVSWQRAATPAESQMPYVLAFDVRAQRLAAAGGAWLAWDAPTHTGPIMWPAEELAGYFLIDVRYAPWADSTKGLPIVNPNRVSSTGLAWVTAPILKLIDQLYGPAGRPEILDSWTADARSNILRDWVEILRDAMPPAKSAGDAILAEMIKKTYTETFGMMASPGGRVYRRDWYAAIVDEARCRLLRKIRWPNGITPLKVVTDCAYYPSDTRDTAEFLRAFGQEPEKDIYIGHFKLEKDKCTDMKTWLENVHTGRPRRRERVA